MRLRSINVTSLNRQAECLRNRDGQLVFMQETAAVRSVIGRSVLAAAAAVLTAASVALVWHCNSGVELNSGVEMPFPC